MHIFKVTLVSIMLVVSGCYKEKTLDGTTAESLSSSIKKIKESMSDKEKLSFDMAVFGICQIEGRTECMKQLDGKTAKEILIISSGIANRSLGINDSGKSAPEVVYRKTKEVDWLSVKEQVELLSDVEVTGSKGAKEQLEKFLLENKENWSLDEKFYQSVIHGSFEHAQEFIRLGANVNSRNNSDNVPAIAVKLNNRKLWEKTLYFLLENKANPNVTGKYGQTPIGNAIFYRNYVAIELLVGSGADLEADYKGSNYVNQAAAREYPEIVEYLVSKGVDYNIVDHGGMTPLHYLARAGYNDTVIKLIDMGANIDIGKVSLLEYSEINGNKIIADYIKSKM